MQDEQLAIPVEEPSTSLHESPDADHLLPPIPMNAATEPRSPVAHDPQPFTLTAHDASPTPEPMSTNPLTSEFPPTPDSQFAGPQQDTSSPRTASELRIVPQSYMPHVKLYNPTNGTWTAYSEVAATHSLNMAKLAREQWIKEQQKRLGTGFPVPTGSDQTYHQVDSASATSVDRKTFDGFDATTYAPHDYVIPTQSSFQTYANRDIEDDLAEAADTPQSALRMSYSNSGIVEAEAAPADKPPSAPRMSHATLPKPLVASEPPFEQTGYVIDQNSSTPASQTLKQVLVSESKAQHRKAQAAKGLDYVDGSTPSKGRPKALARKRKRAATEVEMLKGGFNEEAVKAVKSAGGSRNRKCKQA